LVIRVDPFHGYSKRASSLLKIPNIWKDKERGGRTGEKREGHDSLERKKENQLAWIIWVSEERTGEE